MNGIVNNYGCSLTSRASESFWPGHMGSTSENQPSLIHDGALIAFFSFIPYVWLFVDTFIKELAVEFEDAVQVGLYH